MKLELDAEEAALVLRVLRNRMLELRNEVHHDHTSTSRAYLQHKERILQRVIDRFGTIDEQAHQRGYASIV